MQGVGVEISKKQPKIKDHERTINMKKFLFTFEGMNGIVTQYIQEETIEKARKAATWFYGEPITIREASDEDIKNWFKELED